MATPNIVPQIDNDGALGRHGLRWSSVASYVLSSPVIRLVASATSAQELYTQLSIDSEGNLLLLKSGEENPTQISSSEVW